MTFRNSILERGDVKVRIVTARDNVAEEIDVFGERFISSIYHRRLVTKLKDDLGTVSRKLENEKCYCEAEIKLLNKSLDDTKKLYLKQKAANDKLIEKIVSLSAERDSLTQALEDSEGSNEGVIITVPHLGKKVSIIRSKVNKILELTSGGKAVEPRVIRTECFPNYTFNTFRKVFLTPYLMYLQGAYEKREKKMYYLQYVGTGQGALKLTPIDKPITPRASKGNSDIKIIRYLDKNIKISHKLAMSLVSMYFDKGVCNRDELTEYIARVTGLKATEYSRHKLARMYLIYLKLYCEGRYAVSIMSRTFSIRVIDTKVKGSKTDRNWEHFKANYLQTKTTSNTPTVK